MPKFLGVLSRLLLSGKLPSYDKDHHDRDGRPKRMRSRTYRRLEEKLDRYDAVISQHFSGDAAKSRR